MKKIGIIVAMPKEAEDVINWLKPAISVEKVGGFSVNIFHREKLEIYLIVSGVGEIFASSASQTLVCKYNVDCLINFGLCGSLSDKSLGEMCYVEAAVHYDFDLSKLEDCQVGEYPTLGLYLKPSQELVKILNEVSSNTQGCICASGDKFVCDKDFKDRLNSRYNADICEMECAAVYICAINAKIPALAIKIVSDSKNHAEEFNDFVSRKNFDFISILDKILKKMG